MKNILSEKPDYNLNGRLLASVKFVDDADVANKEILDIGCGYGWCELNFLQRGAKRISAMEISEESLQTIRQNITDERLLLKTGGATNLPFENESFDTVVAWEVLEHIPVKSEPFMFKEIYRVLKPGGHFYLSTPNSSIFSNIFDPAWWFIGHRHYTEQMIKQLGEEGGFKIETIEVKGGCWTVLDWLNLYFSKWILRRSILCHNFFSNKENQEYGANYTKGFANLFVKFVKN